jgi:hypothetical protein
MSINKNIPIRRNKIDLNKRLFKKQNEEHTYNKLARYSTKEKVITNIKNQDSKKKEKKLNKKSITKFYDNFDLPQNQESVHEEIEDEKRFKDKEGKEINTNKPVFTEKPSQIEPSNENKIEELLDNNDNLDQQSGCKDVTSSNANPKQSIKLDKVNKKDPHIQTEEVANNIMQEKEEDVLNDNVNEDADTKNVQKDEAENDALQDYDKNSNSNVEANMSNKDDTIQKEREDKDDAIQKENEKEGSIASNEEDKYILVPACSNPLQKGLGCFRYMLEREYVDKIPTVCEILSIIKQSIEKHSFIEETF